MSIFPIIAVTERCKLLKNGKSKTRNVKSIKNIMIHHSGSIDLNIDELIHLHTVSLHQWATVGYHFYVTKSGTIYHCNPITDIVNGCLNFNSNCIHVCFEGNYMVHDILIDFNACLNTIINFLPSVCRRANIIKHKDKKNTLCPGTFLCDLIDAFNDNRYEKTGLIWSEIE